ncbi:MAG: redox-sensitive transcriptional activator SoxR [Rhizobiaceae bacterium]|nr:redox-sensitive transcriptional activator SoxR [Rhizobiaceae bacterium]
MARIETTLSIGEVAKRTGTAVSAIRYYDDEGLIRSERNNAGQRRFLRSEIRRVSFILIAQELGFSLNQIRTQLDQLPDKRTPTKRDWGKMSKHFRGELDKRITQLEELRDKLDGCIGCGCLSLDACRLYNKDDRAAQKGDGPRYLMGDVAEVD